MSPKLHLDYREFHQAMNQYAKATKKDSEEILNKAALNAMINPKYGAIANTPKADRGEITETLTGPDRLAIKLASKRLAGSEKKGKWQKQVGRKARRIVSRRKSAAGYIVAGFISAGGDVGGRRRQASKFKEKLGKGKKATEQRLMATLINYAEGADIVAYNILIAAIRGAALDMKDYADRKLSKTANKYSGR